MKKPWEGTLADKLFFFDDEGNVVCEKIKVGK